MTTLREAAQAAADALESIALSEHEESTPDIVKMWHMSQVAKVEAANLRAALAAEPTTQTRSQKLADAGFHRRLSLWAMEAWEALELIAVPMRPDGSWNRDRSACQRLAAEALGRDETPATTTGRDPFLAGISYPPQQEPTGPNLRCKSVQARLAAQWGYVRAAEPAPQPAPLTDERLAQIWDDALDQLDPRDQLRFIARAIERAIREAK